MDFIAARFAVDGLGGSPVIRCQHDEVFYAGVAPRERRPTGVQPYRVGENHATSTVSGVTVAARISILMTC